MRPKVRELVSTGFNDLVEATLMLAPFWCPFAFADFASRLGKFAAVAAGLHGLCVGIAIWYPAHKRDHGTPLSLNGSGAKTRP